MFFSRNVFAIEIRIKGSTKMVGNKSEWKVKNKNERKNVLFLQKCIFFCTFARFYKTCVKRHK